MEVYCVRLYRPVGQKEYELIAESSFLAFPPRLPEQPIFYPVLNIEYARIIASKWNTKDANSAFVGYVLSFEVEDGYINNFEVHTVGSAIHQEYWIPAEELEQFNKSIIGKIEVVEKY